jgi:hypothetical protein
MFFADLGFCFALCSCCIGGSFVEAVFGSFGERHSSYDNLGSSSQGF